ncbi:hypothetical protein PAL_GLEAN10004949 [Pteropus alecto]|uniref:Uncharacterized protein n=1 Tax=Pteropus alecto TaxID=9402 RepID=L5KL99_PTEAL|nr:hypothetical protein PAL_GLEAN10004949 [Pteropus alecto]
MTLAKLRERHAGHMAISLQAWPGRRLAPSTELQAGGRCFLTASGGLRPTDVLLPSMAGPDVPAGRISWH